MLQEGDRGVYVATLQDALDTAGIPGVGLDGVFGPDTRKGAMDFQRQNGLPADGIVGCTTWQTLTAQVNGYLRRIGDYVLPE